MKVAERRYREAPSKRNMEEEALARISSASATTLAGDSSSGHQAVELLIMSGAFLVLDCAVDDVVNMVHTSFFWEFLFVLVLLYLGSSWSLLSITANVLIGPS